MLLEDDSYKVRVQAAQLLGKLGDPGGAEPLARALSDNNKPCAGWPPRRWPGWRRPPRPRP